MNHDEPKEGIQLVILDSVLYGAARAVDYLGPRGQLMLDQIGDGIFEYCLKRGYLQRKEPQQQALQLRDFFRESGYLSGIDFDQEGDIITETYRGYRYLGLSKKLRSQGCYLYACPMCLADDAIWRKSPDADTEPRAIEARILPDGAYMRRLKLVSKGSAAHDTEAAAGSGDVKLDSAGWDHTAKIGQPIFEAVEYGLAVGFGSLGAQAQLLLDNVGRGILEFLRDELKLELPNDNAKSLETLASFYRRSGLADGIVAELSLTRASAKFRDYRYLPVLEMLKDENIQLVSCPFTLAYRSMLRAHGYALREMTWDIPNRGEVTLNMPLAKFSEQQFDEAKVSAEMDRA